MSQYRRGAKGSPSRLAAAEGFAATFKLMGHSLAAITPQAAKVQKIMTKMASTLPTVFRDVLKVNTGFTSSTKGINQLNIGLAKILPLSDQLVVVNDNLANSLADNLNAGKKREKQQKKWVKNLKKVGKAMAMMAVGPFGDALTMMAAAISPLAPIMEILGEVFGYFGDIIGEEMAPVMEELFAILTSPAIINLVRTLAKIFASLMKVLLPLIEIVLTPLVAILQFVADGFLALMNALPNIFAAVGEWFAGAFTMAGEWLMGAFTMAGEWLAGAFTMFWEALVIVFTVLVKGLEWAGWGIGVAITGFLNILITLINIGIGAYNLVSWLWGGTVDLLKFIDMPSMPTPLAVGTNFVKSGGLALLHPGEAVVPADVVGGGYKGGMGPSITIHINAGMVVRERELDDFINRSIARALQQQRR